MLEYCKGCDDLDGLNCALPSFESRIASRALLLGSLLLDGATRGIATLVVRSLPNPDVFGHVAKVNSAIDESYIPSEACAYLHEQNNNK